MAKLIAARGAQYVLEAEFAFNVEDTMVNTAGTEQNFGLTTTLAGIFDVIKLPPGAVVVGGSVTTEEAFDTAGYDVKIGDATDDDRYLASTDRAAAGQTALVPTGYVGQTGEDIRFTFASDDANTTGRMVIRVEYIITNRINEAQTH